MMIGGYLQSLSAYDPKTLSKPRYRRISIDQFERAKAFALAADSDASRAVLIRQAGNCTEAGRLAEKAADAIASRCSVSFPSS